MKALSTLKSAINHSSYVGIFALIILMPVIFPHSVSAAELQTSGQQALVFEVKTTNSNQNSNLNNNNSISLATVTQADPLVAKLQAYLIKKNSPLAESADKLVLYPSWQRALAISFVESNMCRFTPKVKTKQGWVESHNCSGIGGEKYRIYGSYEEWFSDMSNLLNKPNYINRPIEKFLGYYVQPGSPSWLHGVKDTEAELAEMETQSDSERQTLAQKHNANIIALATFPEFGN